MILNTGRMFLHRRCLAVASDWLLSRLAAYRQAGGVRATQCTSIRPITTIRTRTKDLPLSPPQYLALVRLGSEVERAEGFAATLEPLHFPTRREPERRLDAPRAVDGSAAVDESMVTGESKAVRRELGDHVVAGTVATDSGLRVEVTAIGDDTALAGIQKLVSDAQASSSRAQRLADSASIYSSHRRFESSFQTRGIRCP